MKKTLVLIALTALAAVAFGANPPAIQWQRTFDMHQASSGWWVEPTIDGGFVVAGSAWGKDTDSTSIAVYMVKTDSQGNREWERTYPGRWHVEARCVQQTADGGYVLTGRGALSCYPESFFNQPFLIKTNSLGDLVWCRFYVRDTMEYGFCVRQTPDHGYILTAIIPRGDSGLWLIKTDSLGDVKWERTYDIQYGWLRDDLLIPVQLTPDGGYIIGTRALLKVDSLGNVEWYRTAPQVRETRAVLLTSDGGYAGTGSGYYGSPSREDSVSIYLYKTDQSGNLLWGRDIGGRASRGGYSVIQTPDGGYVVAGVVQPRYPWAKPSINHYGVIIRTDSLGNPVWNKPLPVRSGARCVRQTPDGGFIVAGWWSEDGGVRMTLWKLGPEGQ